jgi:NAD(P)-dependent dehydrogenase (short-subunit alcohol dehydrogenase family)
MNDEKIALVTGSSTGIGLETALTLARNGFHTYASMRNLNKSNKIEDVAKSEGLPLQVIELDVADKISVSNAVDIISKEKNRLDVLVNNAGYGLFGSLEDLTVDEIKDLFETNYFGVVRLIKSSLPLMRISKARRTIVNISSVGGRIGAPILSAYQSTKFAVEGLSESLYYELEPFGIKVVIIEPGFIKTNIMNSSVQAKDSSNSDSYIFELPIKLKRILDQW